MGQHQPERNRRAGQTQELTQKVCHSATNAENPGVSELSHIIQAEIARNGPISFARFMELALYHPGLGYYETGRNQVGFLGDFYTSVSAGELFGQLLAFRFASWLEAFAEGGKDLWLIEAGAHDGQLANDILGWLREQRPELYTRLQYGIVDPSRQRQEWQREKLAEFGGRVRWFDSLASIASLRGDSPLPSPPFHAGEAVRLDADPLATMEPANSGISGVVFSNELRDAMPVQRLGWDASSRAWFEWGVDWDGVAFVWSKLGGGNTGAISQSNLTGELLAVLPEGYTIEVSPAAEAWWREAAGILKHGKLLAIDYGFTQEEMISPARTNGTLRAYRRHQYCNDLLANPGAQDLTAHVNFSAIQAVGEKAGLKTDGYLTQPQFLTGILGEAIKDASLGAWTEKRTRQFQTLTHPQHLGRAFKVLVQTR